MADRVAEWVAGSAGNKAKLSSTAVAVEVEAELGKNCLPPSGNAKYQSHSFS